LFLVQIKGEKELKGDKRCIEIKAKIKLNANLDQEQIEALWFLLEEFHDVFAWHKGELGNCSIDEHAIDTQGLPLCQMNLGRLSYWEEAKVNKHTSCVVTLLVKKDDINRFHSDYGHLKHRHSGIHFPCH